MTSIPAAVTLDPPAEAGAADLIGYGRVSWDQITAMLAGSETAWADYSGFHIRPVPASPPPYSHLWAWTGQWLARARIDNGTAIVGVLAVSGEPPDAPVAESREAVRFQRIKARAWPRSEKRVGQLPVGIASRPFELYLVPGEHPVTFVAASPAPADANRQPGEL